ncbi:MAG: ATP-binding cassette domain-containing protein, partial [Spirochaetaceae bacterium]|nr:ATP-binding cassette domain-containing protein [Spirochaetaceae bacterium]
MRTATSGGVAAQPGESATAQDAAPDGVPPYVEFSSIDKSYDGRTLVVRDLNLSVHEGEFLTLLGPSGSGKTPYLMMLAGFETPSAGTIRIAGRSVHDLPPR